MTWVGYALRAQAGLHSCPQSFYYVDLSWVISYHQILACLAGYKVKFWKCYARKMPPAPQGGFCWEICQIEAGVEREDGCGEGRRTRIWYGRGGERFWEEPAEFVFREIKLASSGTKSWRLGRSWGWFPRSSWHRGPHSYLLVGSMWKWDGSDSDLGSVVWVLPPGKNSLWELASLTVKLRAAESQ